MKNIYILLLLLCFVSAKAQDAGQTEAPKSKSAADILPAAGDIAVGIDALPYLNYLGNIFNNTANNTLALGSNTLHFRYYLTEETAVRVMLSINSTSNIQKFYVQDDAARFADPLSQALVEDKTTTNTNAYALNLGYIMTRGYNRLRGFYGLQIGYGRNRTTQTMQYGNNITVENNSPSTHLGKLAERTLEGDNGLVQNFGGGLIAGVEYYFLPKICIGGEFCLDYTYTWGSQSNIKTEQLVGNGIVEMDKPAAPGNKSSVLTTFRPATYGGLYLMFHF